MITVVVLTAAIAGSAFAYFTSGGLGTASAAVSNLTAPAITAVTPAAGGTVSLTWSVVVAPGAEAVKYYVTRDGGDPGGTCAAPAVPAAATSCKDSEVEVGKHTYTVTVVWRSWSATSSTSLGNHRDRRRDPLHDRRRDDDPHRRASPTT